MDLIPTYNTVIVKLSVPMEQKRGKLLVPVTAENMLLEGEVVGVGPGSFSSTGARLDMDVQLGDTVVINPAAPHQVFLEEGEEYFFVRAEFVLAYRKSARK